MKRFSKDAIARALKVRLLLLDVDGVMTDGTIYLDDAGAQVKGCNIMDGLGLNLLKKAGVTCGIITGRMSGVVSARARELSIEHVFQGCGDKVAAGMQVAKAEGLTMSQVAFVGDDLIDLPLLAKVGLAVAVPGGAQEVRDAAPHVTHAAGGHGAVREVCELILKSQGRWEETLTRYQ